MISMLALTTGGLPGVGAWSAAGQPQANLIPAGGAGAGSAMPMPRITQRLNTGTQDIVLLVPVRETGPLGQVEVRITPQDDVRVAVADLVRVLERTLTPTNLSAVQSSASADGFVRLEDVQGAGIDLTFDPAALEIVLGIDASARLRRRVPLGFEDDESDLVPDASSRFAIALNYQGTLDYEHVGIEEGVRGPRFNLDIDGRLRPIAFENRLTYDGDDDQSFSRQASRLIFDQPYKSLRWTAGDLLPATASFQSAVDVAGIGLSRLTQTYRGGRSLTATTARTLTLQAPATVEIFVNGQPARTLRLGPGTFDLTDLPLTIGASDVQIVIEDEAGDRQVINYDFFSDFALLAPGLSEFDFQIGIDAPLLNNEREYLTERAVATGFYRRGITDRLTAGGNFQLAETAQQVGVEAVFATGFGVFNAELAGSNNDAVGSGVAVRLEYRYTQEIPDLASSRRLNLSVENRSENFSGIEQFPQNSSTGWLVSARYDQPIRRNLSVFVGADYAESRTDFIDDRYGGTAGVAWSPDQRTSVSARVSYANISFSGRDEVSVGITATRRFGFNSSANASYDSASDSFQLGYGRGPGLTGRGIAYNAQLSRERESIGLNGNLGYFGNRGEVGLSHRTAFDRQGDVAAQTTSVRAAGTIAYADGRVAIGPRINGAFAIVDTHPSLGDAAVVIGTRYSQREIARSGFFGPALVGLSTYSRQQVPFDVPDAPQGYDLGDGVFELYPWEHAGFSLTVGSAYNITAIGYLLDGQGEPLVLKSGVARSLSDADAPPRQMFTNRTGRFGISGLSVGRWQVVMAGGETYEFEIGADQGALADIGRIPPASRNAP
jgi:outer membrane usher protein